MAGPYLLLLLRLDRTKPPSARLRNSIRCHCRQRTFEQSSPSLSRSHPFGECSALASAQGAGISTVSAVNWGERGKKRGGNGDLSLRPRWMDFLSIPVGGSRWEGYDLTNGADAILLCGGGTGAGVFSYRAAAEKCCQPRFTADGAVALVAPGAKGFFEPGLGSRGKLRVLLRMCLRCRTPHGLP